MKKQMVSSPAELISAVPFLIGFHPADSLVVVALQGTLITFAVRIDLPELNAPEEEARAAVLHLATVVLRQDAEAVTIIGYGEEPRVAPAVMRISDAFRKAGTTVVDELHVEDGRFWSYLCTDSSCCPPEGQPCEPAHSVVAAEATFAGAVALPNREALSEQLAPVTGDDREAMEAATARAVLRLAALAGERPPPREAKTSDGPRPDGAHPDSLQPNGRLPSCSLDEQEEADSGSTEARHSDTTRPSHPPAAPTDKSRSDPARITRFHDPTTQQAAVAARGWSRPGSAELRLGNVLWASLGLKMPMPEAPDEVAERPDLVSDEDYFFALVRRAGRLAVREAERCYSTGGRLSDDDAAWLGVLLLHVPVRDYAWVRTRTEDWELALWSDLVRRAEPRYRSAPAALLAFVAWRKGMGPLASVAVERALEYKEDYQLGVLMQAAIITGLPPSTLDGWPAVEGLPSMEASPEAEEPDDSDGAPQEQSEKSKPDLPTGSEKTAARKATHPAKPQSARKATDRAEPQPAAEAIDRAEPQPAAEAIDRAEPQPAAEAIDRVEPQPATEGTDQAEPQADSRDTLRPGGHVPKPDSIKRREKLPVRVGPDASPAKPETRPGDGPGKHERRSPKQRRAAHRRI
ncbi:DUF4192 family protein [Actinoplanes sp. CA-051413]|uniref:DUF4192 domain-containing protein n=1 Tax=Actinoplanes sp. CA-051413 TaxID=3239899 RepID=UPI003D959CE9